jgi:hypothetical protein
MLYHHESKSRRIGDTPEKRVCFAPEVAWLDADAAYSPNPTLQNADFALDFLRVRKPWSLTGEEAMVS